MVLGSRAVGSGELVTDVVGFVAFALNVVGNLMLARKSIYGWLVRLASITLWGVYALAITSGPVGLNAVVFFGINCYGWYKWRRDREGHVGSCVGHPCRCGRFA